MRTPSAFTPLGTPEPGDAPKDAAGDQGPGKADELKAKAAELQAKAQELKAKAPEYQAKAQELKAQAPEYQAKAKAFADTPEGKVALAFAGGVVASFVLKRFGR